MLYFSKGKIIAILAIVLIGFLFALPNFLPTSVRNNLPSQLQKTVNLGLDLQGGAHMLLEVDLTSVVENELKNQRGNVVQTLRDEGRIRTEYVRQEEDAIVGRFRSAEDAENGMKALQKLETPINPSQIGSPKSVHIEAIGDRGFRVTITPGNIESIKDRTIAQSIEVLRKRIDPTGTTEMTLAKEGKDRILLQIPGAKDISTIKDRIKETANLSFHMVRPESFSPRALELARDGRTNPGDKYYDMQDGSSGLIVQDRTRITGACLKSASEGIHPERSDAIVNFSFDLRCSQLFGKLTSENIGKQFAVILDKEIITAPRINGPITGGSGFIEGSFTMESARELALLLNAGALPASLNIVEERTVGAELGADAIRAGRNASIIALIAVAIFMWLFYGLRFGSFANTALFCNIILILGALSLLQATLTLPGIAGIILTMGMAVDANVLIFERIREEMENGRPPVSAIETGYRMSLAPILDANITTLIAAVTLYFVGSGPIRGFAVTLVIGIIMSVFTAVIVARLLTASWLRASRPKTLPI